MRSSEGALAAAGVRRRRRPEATGGKRKPHKASAAEAELDEEIDNMVEIMAEADVAYKQAWDRKSQLRKARGYRPRFP